LKVTDDIVGFQPFGHFRSPAVADPDDHLVGFSEIDGGVSGHIQTALLHGPGEGFGVGNHAPLVFILEVVHFIGCHQQAEKRSEMVVGE